MRIGSYRIEIPFEDLKSYKRILLQLPSGLKVYAGEIADVIENKSEAEVLISSGSCFGACDVDIDYAKSVGADAILHIGHLPIPHINLDFPVKFINAVMDINTKDVANLISTSVKEKDISLVTTAQHIDYIDEIKKELENIGYRVRLNKGDKRIARPGLVLGCNFSSVSKDSEAVVFIGTGTFHPLGISFSTEKNVYSINPLSMEVLYPDKLQEEAKKLLRKRFSLITASKDANVFGIIVSKKPGQNRFSVALEIRKKLNAIEKKSYIIVSDDVSADSIRDFGKFDCLISTACPRIAMDDYINFDVPILTVVEFEILIGERELEDYKFDSISAGSGI